MYVFIVIIIIFIIVLKIIDSPKYKGKSGENIVREKLEKINSYSNIINDEMFNDNGKSRQIDHIAIFEYGVFVIETKNYGGTIYGKESSTEWKQYLNRKKFPFKNPIHQNYGHTEIIKKILEDVTDKIYPVVVFTKRCELKVEVKSTVIHEDQLEDYIRSKEKSLDIQKIDEIYNTLMENRITDDEAIRNHNYNVKRYVEYKENIASGGKCPRCNGKLIKRHGKKGYFYGCSNYPKCKYTKDIEINKNPQ